MNYYDLQIMCEILCLCLIFWLILAYSLIFTIVIIIVSIMTIFCHWDRLHILRCKFGDLFNKDKF